MAHYSACLPTRARLWRPAPGHLLPYGAGGAAGPSPVPSRCVNGALPNRPRRLVLARAHEALMQPAAQLLSLLPTGAAAAGAGAGAGAGATHNFVPFVDLAAAVEASAAPDFGQSLYEAITAMDALTQQQLQGVTPATFAVVLAAGLVTSLSPCTLSVLPLTIGYIGGYSSSERSSSSGSAGGEGGGAGAPTGGSSAGARSSSGSSSSSLLVQAASFAAGLATTLAALGVFSTFVGRTYGQLGSGVPAVAVSLVAVAMGLNLLEVLPLRLPSLDVDVRRLGLPPPAQAYLAGATFALAASPCSTPILATLLAYVSSTGDPLTGGALLLSYTSGYVAPLLVAASATGALKGLLSVRQYSAWVTPASGVLLVAGGTYGLVSRLLPA